MVGLETLEPFVAPAIVLLLFTVAQHVADDDSRFGQYAWWLLLGALTLVLLAGTAWLALSGDSVSLLVGVALFVYVCLFVVAFWRATHSSSSSMPWRA
ncbi:hypothetical protein [Haloarchaeobius sp. DFWS5]|uniref:hypothetical protein n=1 Tax=Haloarchaeobius sp. DFWS5 TaxID=3446114 RepID=UPI003EB9CCF4